MTERLARELRAELTRLGAGGSASDAVRVWSDAVGDVVARHAWPARVGRDGTLHVATESSTWAFELTQLAATILARLREHLGGDAPAAVRFAPGPVPSPPAQDAAGANRLPPRPGPQEWAFATRAVASIDDEELRELVRRAAAASLARQSEERPSDRRF